MQTEFLTDYLMKHCLQVGWKFLISTLPSGGAQDLVGWGLGQPAVVSSLEVGGPAYGRRLEPDEPLGLFQPEPFYDPIISRQTASPSGYKDKDSFTSSFQKVWCFPPLSSTPPPSFMEIITDLYDTNASKRSSEQIAKLFLQLVMEKSQSLWITTSSYGGLADPLKSLSVSRKVWSQIHLAKYRKAYIQGSCLFWKTFPLGNKESY